MERIWYIISEVIFYSGQRRQLPVSGYRSDAVFMGNRANDYWGITFTDLSVVKFDTPTLAEMRFTFQDDHYKEVEKGQLFQIMEGSHKVGEGKVVLIECREQTQNSNMLLHSRKLMPPPWLAYPEIERYSIGWRMGCGEDYIDRFSDWLGALSQEEKTEYQILFPEPVTWKGWWDNNDTSEVLVHGEFCIPLWRQAGMPKYTRTQLQQECSDGKQQELCLFWGHHPSNNGSITKSCFSQWWMDGFWSIAHNYCCMEQYMMEQKADLFGDEQIRQQILENKEPKQMKALGQKVRNFDQVLWEQAKYSIVLNGNWCKFSQNRALKEFLLSTGDNVLAESSPYDLIWGIGFSSDSPDAQNPLKWRGKNLLGFALMEVRDELRRVTRNESLCDWSW